MFTSVHLLPNSVVQTWESPVNESSLNRAYGHQFEGVKSYQSPYNHQIAKIHDKCRCYIVPPHLQKDIEAFKRHTGEYKDHELLHSDKDKAFRRQRKTAIANSYAFSFHLPHPFGHHQKTPAPKTSHFDPTPFIKNIVRTVYDANHMQDLPGQFVISSKGEFDLPGYTKKGETQDLAVTQAMENALNVFLFYLTHYQYNSIDGKGMPITSCVHYEENYDNAFWDGSQMVYGDGSKLFDAFVDYLDVVGHELTHGVTGDRLVYEGEAGALNEHFSDVMGYLVYLFVNKLDVKHANWRLADGILRYKGKTYPLRSFAAPGTAYNIDLIGKDPQPAKYGDLYRGSDDDGGVHINSGIPNHAFYLFALELGGYAWEKAGLIWFTTMMTPDAFKPNASMADFAHATLQTAQNLFKEEPKVKEALLKAWRSVEVLK